MLIPRGLGIWYIFKAWPPYEIKPLTFFFLVSKQMSFTDLYLLA